MTMRFSRLTDWLQWMEGLHPKAIDLGLERVLVVASKLDLVPAVPVVTVAGTNGKGSCIALLDAVLTSEGYRVASYTSPHLLCYNERVRLGSRCASDVELIEAFAAVDQARGEVSLSYFEFGTLAALWLFSRWDGDVVLLEVGLGGRLDAVNIVDPDIAVITSVALDHEAWLGNTRDAIGREKAGIMRAGKHAVFGDALPLASLTQHAQAEDVLLLSRNSEFGFSRDEQCWRWWGQRQGERLEYTDLPLPSILLDNAATVLQVLQLLREQELPVGIEAIRRGLARVRVAGRQQRLQVDGVEVWLDVAHNPAAIEQLEACLRSAVQRNCAALFAVMGDKDVDGIVCPLLPHFSRWYLPALENNTRAMAPDKLRALLTDRGAQVAEAAGSVASVFDAALATLGPADRLVVFGSFFTVAAVLEYLQGPGSAHSVVEEI